MSIPISYARSSINSAFEEWAIRLSPVCENAGDEAPTGQRHMIHLGGLLNAIRVRPGGSLTFDNVRMLGAASVEPFTEEAARAVNYTGNTGGLLFPSLVNDVNSTVQQRFANASGKGAGRRRGAQGKQGCGKHAVSACKGQGKGVRCLCMPGVGTCACVHMCVCSCVYLCVRACVCTCACAYFLLYILQFKFMCMRADCAQANAAVCTQYFRG